MFEWLTAFVTASPATYAVVLALALADLTGLVPAEAVIVTATLLALRGPLLLVGVAFAAVGGVAAGDAVLYLLGRQVGAKLAPRLFRSESARERLSWARRQMDRHGSVIIIAGRWLPMGRTATIFAAGSLELPWRRCALADAVAIGLWAGYYVGVTAALGGALQGKVWVSILLSLGIATVVGLAAEGVRRYTVRRRRAGPVKHAGSDGS